MISATGAAGFPGNLASKGEVEGESATEWGDQHKKQRDVDERTSQARLRPPPHTPLDICILVMTPAGDTFREKTQNFTSNLML